MAPPDRSWTITPTIAWFVGTLVVALLVFDGGVGALADRLTRKRPTAAAPAGPTFAAPRPGPVVADTSDAKPVTAAALHLQVKAPHLEDTCVDGTPTACKRWAMDAFYHAVEATKSGTLGRAMRVSWYGDSVIATDEIPGRLRARLQKELGDGGPGFVFLVAPHRYCGHEAITLDSSSDWTSHAISTTLVADGLYGVGGSTADSDDGRVRIKLNKGTATNVELYYLAQPHGGTITIAGDGSELLHAETKGDKQPGFAAATTAGVHEVKLTSTGHVRVFGLDLENARGAVVDNLGIVSVNVKSLANNEPAHFAAQLAHRGADLVMIMIGANEAQWLHPGDRDTKDYQAHYEKVLAPIRLGRPEASCLVVSPLDQAEEKDGEYPSRPIMPVLVAAQRAAALAQGCAFYSTYEWMNGRGSAAEWFRKGLVGTDFQHLSPRGANLMADAVFDALMSGAHQHATH
ncbi:MAG TPA: GDSL-type esterase/lipase family protein [Kofleriaceae bacterium]|nr:GDSL-type esterase/lipase family protein [Kofleriaceae bacterium]